LLSKYQLLCSKSGTLVVYAAPAALDPFHVIAVLLQQVAPRVIAVRVAPVFRLILKHHGCAIGPGILGRGEPVQRILSERLIAAVGCVFVIDNSKNIAVIGAAVGGSVSVMEVIADGKDGLARRGGRHGQRLKLSSPIAPQLQVSTPVTR